MYRLQKLAALALCVFFTCCNKDKTVDSNDNSNPAPEIVDGLHIGLVGFHNDVTVTDLTYNVTYVKQSIDNLNNDQDATAMCYGITTAIDMLKNSGIAYDATYIVVLTDGFDNSSAKHFNNIYQHEVINYTRNQLLTTKVNGSSIKCYTLGLTGKGELRDDELTSLAVNGGEYRKASSESLNEAFQTVANSLISTSKNFSMITNAVPIAYSNPKYVKMLFTLSETTTSPVTSSYINGKFYYTNSAPKFEITAIGPGISFDGNVGHTLTGTVEYRKGIEKAVIPLKNLSTIPRHIRGIEVKITLDTTKNYVQDVEDTNTEEVILKNVGVVLVLDCSTSMGDDFSKMKNYAKEFVNKLVQSKM